MKEGGREVGRRMRGGRWEEGGGQENSLAPGQMLQAGRARSVPRSENHRNLGHFTHERGQGAQVATTGRRDLGSLCARMHQPGSVHHAALSAKGQSKVVAVSQAVPGAGRQVVSSKWRPTAPMQRI